MHTKHSTIIGIAGGSCSGKTTLAQQLFQSFEPDTACLIFQDSYYIDQSHKFKEDGGEVNFDHPSAIEFSLLIEHLKALKSGQAVQVPNYDFVTHTRKIERQHFPHKPVVIVDGTLLFAIKDLRPCLDFKFFVEASEKLRLERRKERDVTERGRSLSGILRQFENHVKPMHDQFVEPSKAFADQIIPGDRPFDEVILQIRRRFESKL